MSPNLLIIFHILPIFSLLLSAAYIFALRGNKRPVSFISWARLFTAILLLVNFVQFYGTAYHMHVLWNPLHIFMCLLAYPLLFAYLFLLMRPGSLSWSYWFFAYLPLVVLTLLAFIFQYTHGVFPPLTSYEDFELHKHHPEIILRIIGLIVFVLELIVFATLTLKMQYEHKQRLQSEFSYTEGASLTWVRWNISLSLAQGATALLGIVCEGVIFKAAAGLLLTVEPIISTMLVLRQKDLYRQLTRKEALIEEETENADALINEQPQEKHIILKMALVKLLEEDEIFKDPELNSDKVREMLGTNRTYLSQLINHDLQTTFYQLINTHRLNKALHMMQTPLYQNMPLKNIAEICGFKSQSAFTTFFREEKGCSPSEWVQGKRKGLKDDE